MDHRVREVLGRKPPIVLPALEERLVSLDAFGISDCARLLFRNRESDRELRNNLSDDLVL